MKLFAVSLTYEERFSGFYTTECVIISAKDEDEAEEIIQKHLESLVDDRHLEHRTHPMLIDTTSKGVVFSCH